MPRPRQLDALTEARIGQAVRLARRQGVAWKVLMKRYDLGRTKLYELAKGLPPHRSLAGKDVREHLGAGQTRRAAANVVALAR